MAFLPSVELGYTALQCKGKALNKYSTTNNNLSAIQFWKLTMDHTSQDSSPEVIEMTSDGDEEDTNISNSLFQQQQPSSLLETKQNFSKKRTGCIQNMGRDSKDGDSNSSSNSGNGISTLKSNSILNTKVLIKESTKFMEDFDPTNSSRNQQKRKKRYHPLDGRLIQFADDYENCDCLRPNCQGCHFPCRSCDDRRCGMECRVNRKWIYESVEVEGNSHEMWKNPNLGNFTST